MRDHAALAAGLDRVLLDVGTRKAGTGAAPAPEMRRKFLLYDPRSKDERY